jgi:uncharacterized membrane protein (DUF4010 family)
VTAFPLEEAGKIGLALAIGLLIGAERERRKPKGARRGAAGVRTFAVAALCGAIAADLGEPYLMVAGLLAIGALAVVSHLKSRSSDPGMTTEVALVATYLLGVLSVSRPAAAAAGGVVVTVLLAARERLHRFVRAIVTGEEIRDGLILLAAIAVVLPLVPAQPIGPGGAVNLRTVWKLVVLVMAIGAAGHVAVRAVGARLGLPLAGLASGFASSAATVASMGRRAKEQPRICRAASAGAALSTVATIIELTAVLAATSVAVLRELRMPLLLAGAAAVVAGGFFAIRSARTPLEGPVEVGRPINIKTALVFAATVTAVLFISALITRRFGKAGLLAACAVAGFADVHATSISVAALVAAGKLSARDAMIPILAAFTTNSITKGVLAFASGGWQFALPVVIGLAAVVAAMWAGAIGMT